jgi:periplasmic copper chaperone A
MFARNVALAALLAVFPLVLSAQTVALKINEPWVRATIGQQSATGAFMQITAPSAMRLVEARSPVAGVVEIHEMAVVNNVMRMRQIEGLDLPAGRVVELKPGGYHVMLMSLKNPIKVGDQVPLTLVVEGPDKKRETIEIMATARPLSASSGAAHKH